MLTALLFWIIVDLVAGFLTRVLICGGSYGVVGDIVSALISGFMMKDVQTVKLFENISVIIGEQEQIIKFCAGKWL